MRAVTAMAFNDSELRIVPASPATTPAMYSSRGRSSTLPMYCTRTPCGSFGSNPANAIRATGAASDPPDPAGTYVTTT